MSKNTLALLKRIGFLDKRNTPVDLNRRDDEWIHSRLSSYFRERSRTADADMKKMPAPTGQSLNALISSVSATNTVTSLLPSLLLYDHLITDDPLFREATPEPDHTTAQKQSLGVTPRRFIDRKWTTNKLQYFSMLAPLIEALSGSFQSIVQEARGGMLTMYRVLLRS